VYRTNVGGIDGVQHENSMNTLFYVMVVKFLSKFKVMLLNSNIGI